MASRLGSSCDGARGAPTLTSSQSLSAVWVAAPANMVKEAVTVYGKGLHPRGLASQGHTYTGRAAVLQG